MSSDFLLALAAEAPSCRVIKLEEEPTPPKAGRLVDGSPDVIVLGGLGGEMLIEELRRGSHGTMTGFGFPEILVAVVRRWFAGDGTARAALFDRYATVIRFENQALLNLPIRKPSTSARRDRPRDRPRPGRAARPGHVADLDAIIARSGSATGWSGLGRGRPAPQWRPSSSSPARPSSRPTACGQGGLAIADGRIVAVGLPATCLGRATAVDGRRVGTCSPGVIDTHVHARDPSVDAREDFGSATAAAAVGGITTILEMPISTPSVHERRDVRGPGRDRADRRRYVDFGLYGGAAGDNLDDDRGAGRGRGRRLQDVPDDGAGGQRARVHRALRAGPGGLLAGARADRRAPAASRPSTRRMPHPRGDGRRAPGGR